MNVRKIAARLLAATALVAGMTAAAAGVRVTIEERFTTGQSAVRAVPERGCAVAMPYAGTGDPASAVRSSRGCTAGCSAGSRATAMCPASGGDPGMPIPSTDSAAVDEEIDREVLQ